MLRVELTEPERKILEGAAEITIEMLKIEEMLNTRALNLPAAERARIKKQDLMSALEKLRDAK